MSTYIVIQYTIIYYMVARPRGGRACSSREVKYIRKSIWVNAGDVKVMTHIPKCSQDANGG